MVVYRCLWEGMRYVCVGEDMVCVCRRGTVLSMGVYRGCDACG